MPRLSAFLITKNEAGEIADCLAALRGLADEIVVVDDESADATRQLCEQAGARVWVRRLDGFAAQKQFALDHTTGDWAFSVDADERVTPALAEEIRQAIQNPRHAGYEISREMFFLGHRLRHGGVGRDHVLRLFQRGKGRYRQVRVHERIDVEGSVGQLRAPLLHYSYQSLEEYLQKADHYTNLAARDLYEKGRRFHWFDHLRPFWELAQRLLIKCAWLDGRPGIVYAALSAHTAWVRAIKIWELQDRARGGSQ